MKYIIKLDNSLLSHHVCHRHGMVYGYGIWSSNHCCPRIGHHNSLFCMVWKSAKMDMLYVCMDGWMYVCMHVCIYVCIMYVYIYINTPICFFSESNFWPWRWEFTGNTQACSQHPEYNGKMAILTANFCPENSPRWFSHLSRSWNKPVPGPKPCNLSPEEDLWDQMIEDRRNPRPPRVLNEISSKLTKNIPSVRVDLPTNQISPYVYIYISVTHLI